MGECKHNNLVFIWEIIEYDEQMFYVASIINVLNNLPHLFHFIHENFKELTVKEYLRKLA